ncbi:hypothetical protein E4665_03355 [Sporolactobacillus shoreae]|uniref:LXG domain-containing protein n=1 Tax=Sporolactobacillus shoreae TaxID=1465501 RepID=A0A4Z0GRQ6_9BACL|nr:HNH endonuclease [Sporolactobacillus shoreae]TGA99999.1 hypothetical protein E4665_03355 [Sporolactobacillus shoreae]
MGRDVSYKQSSWEDMGEAISHVSTWGGTLDQMRRADQAFQQIRDAVESLDEDHRISFSYKSLSGALDKLGNDYQKLYTFTGEVGDAVNRHIDHPFYTEIDAFVSAMAQLSISQFHTKNTLNVTEMQATSTMANVATYEKVTKKDITLDDLFNTSSLMKASLRSEYENFKALSTSDQAEKVTFDQYKEAIQYNYSFDYKSIKDKQIDKEFWVNLGIGAAIVVLTIACPPAGAVAGVAYGAMQMSDAVTGKSWISGRELSTGERVSSAAFGALDVIPGAEAAGAFGTIGRASMRSAEKVADLTKTLGQASKGRLIQLRQISHMQFVRARYTATNLGEKLPNLSLGGGPQLEAAGVSRVGGGEGFIQNMKNTFQQMASKNIGSVSKEGSNAEEKVLNSNLTKGYDVEPKYSSVDDRIKVTPSQASKNGKWLGERGESTFVSDDTRVQSVLDEKGVKGIEYKNGMPDFSEFAEAEFKINDMTNSRASNFYQADEKLAEQWTESTGKEYSVDDVANWRRENGYTWHELNDLKTVQLVPSIINAPIFKHLGGVGEFNIMLKKGK